MSAYRTVNLMLVGGVLLAGIGALASAKLLAAYGPGWRVDDAPAGVATPECGAMSPAAGPCAALRHNRWSGVDAVIAGRRVEVPTALAGTAYFVALGIGVVFAGGPRTQTRWLWRSILALAATGMVISTLLFRALTASPEPWCMACITVHAVNALLVGTLGAAWYVGRSAARRAAPEEAPTQDWRRTGIAWCASVAAAAAIWAYFDAAATAQHYWQRTRTADAVLQTLKANPAALMAMYRSQPIEENVGAPGAVIGGADTAPVRSRVVLFVPEPDQRHKCAVALWWNVIVPNLDGAVEVRVRCSAEASSFGADEGTAARANARGSGSIAAAGERRLLALEAARRCGGAVAWRNMYSLLMSEGAGSAGTGADAEPDYAALAGRAGLDREAFLRAYEAEETAQVVWEDDRAAEQLGVRGQLAAFVDGRRVPGVCLSSQAFWQALGSGARHELLGDATPSASTPDARRLAHGEDRAP